MKAINVSTTGLILLAAGAASRMGRLKQLLPVHGRPLVRQVVENLLPAGLSPVVVVLGAQAAEVGPALAGLPVHLVTNAAWAEGMGSSLRTGVETALRLQPGLTGLIVALADQPGLTAAHLGQILAEQRCTGRTMVAWDSNGVPLPPAYFGAEHFPSLLALPADTGARALLRSAGPALATVRGEALPDLDPPEDYNSFLHRVAAGKSD